MVSFRSWLPPAAIDRGVRGLPLRQTVADWSAQWFLHGGTVVAGEPAAAGMIDARNGSIWESPNGAVLVLAAGSDRSLAGMMFGGLPDDAELTTGDRNALDACVSSCRDDLLGRLDTLFHGARRAAWRSVPSPALDVPRWWTWRIEDARGGLVARVAADEALIAGGIRDALPPAPARPRLASLASGLAHEQIGVSAAVGRCLLSTSDLAGLAPGDVLVLDTKLDAAVPIAVNCSPRAMRGIVRNSDDRLSVVIA